jgi:hypothetical protein
METKNGFSFQRDNKDKMADTLKIITNNFWHEDDVQHSSPSNGKHIQGKASYQTSIYAGV